MRYALIGAVAAFTVGCSAFGGIAALPGLQSVTVFERTGGSQPTGITFLAGDARLATRVGTLTAATRDFAGATSEFYDVFYSDSDGTPNPQGDWITVDCVFESGNGGCNIAEIRLNFLNGVTEFASVVANVRSGGVGAFPATGVLAADGDLLTHTTLGTGGNTNRLGVTVSFASVPTPTTAAVLGLAGLCAARRKR